MPSFRNRLFLILITPFLLTLFQRVATAQQCANCTPISIPDTVVAGDPNGGGRDTYDINSTPAVYTGSAGQSVQPAFINVVISQSGTTPLPANLPAGTYPAWCGTSPTDGNGPQNYTATTVNNPYSATQWNEINYILNHKQGYVIDVQVAIWGVLGTIAESDMVDAGYTTAANLYNAAVTNGQNFTPAPGQHTAVILLSQHRSGDAVWQHLILEMINCGSIGQVFWNDSTNHNGILPFTTSANGILSAAEPGINGVTVNLLDSNHNVIATTVTAPSPIQYPYLPPDTNGWYQFTGLCAGAYSVSFDANQAALAGLLLETPVTNQTYPVIYNNPNPIPVTLSSTANPMVNEANNFGFTGYAPLNVTCASMVGTVNVAYSSAMMVTGGVAPYTYNLASGSLPPGLTLNPNTGAIMGVPTTAGTYTFSIQVKDSSGLAAGTTTTNCTIVIAPPPITLQCASGMAVMGRSYSSMLQAAGGMPAYTFSIVGGSLPPGLTLNTSTGAITGTPTSAGTFMFTAKVVDSSGNSANSGTVNCSITVVTAPAANCVTITAVQGAAITPVTLTGTGGAGGPYTFSATGLPAGLTLSSNGTISGTPTASGTFNYSVTVKDSAGNTGTVNCSVTVNAPVTANCAAITVVQGIAITPVTMTTSGGVGGPYTFTATGLPAGLSISANGTISGTATVSGTFNYSVTVKDSAGNTGTVNCSVMVSAPPAVVANCAAITATEDQAITPVAMAASGGLGGPYTFTATGLSAGLNISSTGTISGTPTVSGTFNYSVMVKDPAGNTGTMNCSATVSAPPPSGPVSAGDTATIGFWHNKNGQALILDANGSSSSTALADWLASQFPYLYGPHSSNDLTNETNQDVANLFMTFFGQGGQKTDAQIMAGALACYFTTSTLSGTTATSYGFNSSSFGTGSKTYNAGSSGLSVGLSNNQSYTVSQLLQQVNASLANGTYNSYANGFNTIFSNINQTGDIK